MMFIVDVHASKPLHHVVVLHNVVGVIERIALDGAIFPAADLLEETPSIPPSA